MTIPQQFKMVQETAAKMTSGQLSVWDGAQQLVSDIAKSGPFRRLEVPDGSASHSLIRLLGIIHAGSLALTLWRWRSRLMNACERGGKWMRATDCCSNRHCMCVCTQQNTYTNTHMLVIKKASIHNPLGCHGSSRKQLLWKGIVFQKCLPHILDKETCAATLS
jgi:hypothetical protein